MSRNKTVTYKGTCTVHESREIKEWFYPELAGAIRYDDEEGAALFAQFLDSPRRVVLQVEPTQRIGYDGAKMAAATVAWMEQQAGQESADS